MLDTKYTSIYIIGINHLTITTFFKVLYNFFGVKKHPFCFITRHMTILSVLGEDINVML